MQSPAALPNLILSLFLLAALCIPMSAVAQINPFAGEDEGTKSEAADEDTKQRASEDDSDAEEEESEEEEDAEAGEDATAPGQETEIDEDEGPIELMEPDPGEPTASASAGEETTEVSEDNRAYGAPVDPATVPRIPLLANFGMTELVVTGLVTLVGPPFLAFGSRLFGQPEPSIGPPSVGSLDYEISISQHGNLETGESVLFGIPDFVGIALPATFSAYYLSSAVYYWAADAPLLGYQTVNIDHSAIGYFETIGWTAFFTAFAKLLIGRERPYRALNRSAFDDGRRDNNESFFSGHTSMGFAMTSFVAWDISDHLVHRSLSGSDTRKFWLGRVLPFAGFYGLASAIAYTRIVDQKHFFSDVFTGAVVGTGIGNLVYNAHFDRQGNPRIRHPENLAGMDISVRPTLSLSRGETVHGLGISGNW